MQLTQENAQKRLADLYLDDMPIISVRPRTTIIPGDWFNQYKKLCKDFAMGLMDSVQELSFLNLSQDQFISLLSCGKFPPNTSIRFRIPLTWGGRLETTNMFMCSTFPVSHNLDRFIIEQSGNETIWLPNPAKKIYVSTHTATGGDGGNATDDRMSQVAAQFVSGRGGME